MKMGTPRFLQCLLRPSGILVQNDDDRGACVQDERPAGGGQMGARRTLSGLRCTGDRLVGYGSWRLMPRRQLLLDLLLIGLLDVTGQTPCPANSVGDGDGSLCVCQPRYHGRLQYNGAVTPPMYEGSCNDGDEGGAELGVVAGIICSLLLGATVAVVVCRKVSTRSVTGSQANKNGTLPTPTQTPPEMVPLSDLKPLVTRMILSHDGVKTITRQQSASPIQAAMQAEPEGGLPVGGLENAIPPFQTQAVAPLGSTTKTLKSLQDAGRSGVGTENSCSGRRRARRNSFEHDEPGLQELQRALADQEAAVILKAGARSTAMLPALSPRTNEMSAESSVASGEALDSIVETWADEMNLSSSTAGSPRLTPSQTMSTPAGIPIRADVDEGIPLGPAHGEM